MRARIVPRFETRRAIYSARSHSFVDIYIFKACSFRRNEAHRTNFFLPAPYLVPSRLFVSFRVSLLSPMVQRQWDSLLLSSVRQRRITNSRHNKKSRFQSVARPRFVPCLFGQMPRPDYPVALHLATFNVGQACGRPHTVTID